MSIFSFLQAEFPAVFGAARQAQAHGNGAGRAACFYARRALELAVSWMYRHVRSLPLPYREDLAVMIHEPGFQQAAGAAISSKARLYESPFAGLCPSGPEALFTSSQMEGIVGVLRHVRARAAA